MTATTDYVSPFPDDLYEPALQSESRLDDPTTIATAALFNRHDVEIRRIEEVLGPMTGSPGTVSDRLKIIEAASGVAEHPYVGLPHTGNADNMPISADMEGNATVGGHAQSTGIHHNGANTLPFHNDPLDDNYAFVKWFLEWMDIWDVVNADGIVSITEVVKALWQNKYDLEIGFMPEFFYPSTATDSGTGWYFKHTLNQSSTIYCGLGTGAIPYKPIGGACNLNVRPYPLYRVQDDGSSQWYEGIKTLPSGTVLRFWTDPILTPGTGDYKVGVFGNPPFSYVQQPSGSTPQPPTGLQPPLPTGLVPPPPPGPPPPPPQGPPVDWDPMDPGNWDLPWDPPSLLDPTLGGSVGGELAEISKILFDPVFDVIHDGAGKVIVAPSSPTGYIPMPFQGFGGGAWSTPTGHTDYGVPIASDAATAVIAAPPGWTTVYAVLTQGEEASPQSTSDLHGYVTEFGLNAGATFDYPAEWDWQLTGVTLATGKCQTIVVAVLYNDGSDLRSFRVTLSDEGTPGSIWVMSFFTRTVSLLQDM